MRNRTSMFLVLALLLLAYPVYQNHRAVAACAAQEPLPSEAFTGLFGLGPEQVPPCAAGTAPPAGLARALGILSVFCFAGFLVSLSANFARRHQEQQLLQRAGVRVAESDLPLED